MSMLKCFFEIRTGKTLFDGLAISQEMSLCEAYMGKYPVIFLSLKGVDGLTFEQAMKRFKTFIQEETIRLHGFWKEECLSPADRKKLSQMENRELPEKEIPDSLKFLSRVLYTCSHKKVILLIDEYDVPLDKAFQHGYYDEMVSLIRGLFGQTLKTNEFLHFAVLTGCLRCLSIRKKLPVAGSGGVSKESIFTGLNNFEVNSIVDVEHDEEFGFTDAEVQALLRDYGLEQNAGPFAEPGELADPVQQGGGRGLQRYSDQHTGACRDCD